MARLKRLALALVLGALLSLPAAPAATTPAPLPYPEESRAHLAKWLEAERALAAPHEGKPWYAEAKAYLDLAADAVAAGRVRTAIFSFETHEELVLAHLLMEEANATGNVAAAKSLVLERTGAWHKAARAEWDAYRARLDALEDDLRSVRALEHALHSADQALSARIGAEDYAFLAQEFPKQPTLERGFVLALVRASHTSLQDLGYATDLLDAVAAVEGVAPRVNESAWAALARAATSAENRTGGSGAVKTLEEVAGAVRARNETILSLALDLAQQRAERATSIEVIYGDARSRGKDVVADAARSLRGHLNNTTLQRPASYGLAGVLTADAADRAEYTLTFAERPGVNLAIFVNAWASLDHAGYATTLLGATSSVRPPPTPAPTSAGTPTGKGAPGVETALLLAGVAVAALVVAGARRR